MRRDLETFIDRYPNVQAVLYRLKELMDRGVDGSIIIKLKKGKVQPVGNIHLHDVEWNGTEKSPERIRG